MTHLDLAIREGFFSPSEWMTLSQDIQDKILIVLYRNRDRQIDAQFRFEIRLLAAILCVPSNPTREKELHVYNVMRFWAQLTDTMDEIEDRKDEHYYHTMKTVMIAFIVIYNNLDPKYENDQWTVCIEEGSWKNITGMPQLVFAKINTEGSEPHRVTRISVHSEQKMLREFERLRYDVPMYRTLTALDVVPNHDDAPYNTPKK